MADDLKPISSSRQPHFSYETPQPVKRENKKLPVKPEAIEPAASDTPSPRHVNKLLSQMWGLVQKVVQSAEAPIATKRVGSSSKAPLNPKSDVETSFSNCREAFKQLYQKISSLSSR